MASVAQDFTMHAGDTNDLYFAWFHEDATSINSDAQDDEVLSVNLLYRLDHRES